MTYHTADYVYPVTSEPIKNGIVAVDDNGRIAAVLNPSSPDFSISYEKVVIHTGVLIPGFINTHCHLELSHLAGKSQTGKTLLPFLVDVVTMRDMPQEAIDAAIAKWDAYMWNVGIQAVGDICNKPDTATVKANSPIRYYSFVEMFDFLQPDRAQDSFEGYRATYDAQANDGGNMKSAVPHAPYTVSDPLYGLINGLNDDNKTVSIHSEETPAELELFINGSGPFQDFFKGFGANIDHFKATGKSSIYHAMSRMNATNRTIFVHNTLTDKSGIEAAMKWGQNGVYFATCPNANLYIENRLPRYDVFIDAGARVTVGTDSLTSNWQLSILEELRTISKYQSYVPFDVLLKWATINGAEALQFDKDMGSIEVGKKPGLLALQHLEGENPKDFRIGNDTEVRRIV